MARPLNFGLTDAVSRIGGWSRPDLPDLLDGIQGVLIYGDVSRSVASEVFEARGTAGAVSNVNSTLGLELASQTAGGIVIEEIDFSIFEDGGTPPYVGLNINTSTLGGAVEAKLDIGGIPTLTEVRRVPAFPSFASRLIFQPNIFTGGGIFRSIQNRTRIWVAPGFFFVCFTAGFGVAFDQSVHVTWRELSDAQGPV